MSKVQKTKAIHNPKLESLDIYRGVVTMSKVQKTKAIHNVKAANVHDSEVL